MAIPQKIVLKLSRWSRALELDLYRVADQDCPLSWYKDQVSHGRLDVWDVYSGKNRVGSVLTRMEGKEFVMVAGAGTPDFDGIAEIFPRMESLATKLGCKSIRVHTKREGLRVKAARLGYGQLEYVLGKAL